MAVKRKILSLLCAASMTVSAFAGLVVTANAAAEPVWSFDGSSTDGWEGAVAPEVKTDEGSEDTYLDFLAGERTESNNITFTLPTEAQLSDDYVLEYDTFIHASNGMGRLNQYTQLAFTGANPVKDTQVYNGEEYLAAAAAVNPDPEHGWNSGAGEGNGYAGDIVSSLTNRIELQGNMLINYDGTKAPSMDDGDAQIGDSRWVRVRAEVKGGKAKVTIADSNYKIVDGEEFAVSAEKLTQIKMTFGRADTQLFIPTTYGNIKLDNIKVYNGIENAPDFSMEGLRKSPIVATPAPAPEKVAGSAPKLKAPESADGPYTADFNSETVGTIASVGTDEQDAKPITNGMKVKVGSRPNGGDQKTYASIVKIANGDNALRLSADQFSTNGRGPVVSLEDDIDLSELSSGSAVMAFAVYLSKTTPDGVERLFLLDNTENVDGNGCARDVVAVITTEDIQYEDESYKYTAGEKNIGIHVEPEMWHTIVIVATAGDSPVRLFVDGKYKDDDGNLSPALKLDMVGTGEGNKHAVTHLPLIAIENAKASSQNEDGTYSGGTGHSTALIDNVLTYYIQGDLEPKNFPITEEAPVNDDDPEITVTIDDTTGAVNSSDASDKAIVAKLTPNGNDTYTIETKVGLTKGVNSITWKTAPKAGDKIIVLRGAKSMKPAATPVTITPVAPAAQ